MQGWWQLSLLGAAGHLRAGLSVCRRGRRAMMWGCARWASCPLGTCPWASSKCTAPTVSTAFLSVWLQHLLKSNQGRKLVLWSSLYSFFGFKKSISCLHAFPSSSSSSAHTRPSPDTLPLVHSPGQNRPLLTLHPWAEISSSSNVISQGPHSWLRALGSASLPAGPSQASPPLYLKIPKAETL